MPPGFRLLQISYALFLVVAGADKFFHLLVDWTKYLAPVIRRALPVTGNVAMDAIGVVEIVAGLLVIVRPRIGGYAAAAVLLLSVVDFLLIPGYFDIAFRNLALGLGAIALARMSARRLR
jgi:hypothetical protein